MVKFISVLIPASIASACCVLSVLQFRGKGPVLNNAYLFASKQKRARMDKRPYYRQSGILFALLSGLFACTAVENAVETGWLYYPIGGIPAATVLYAIISAIEFERKK